MLTIIILKDVFEMPPHLKKIVILLSELKHLFILSAALC